MHQIVYASPSCYKWCYANQYLYNFGAISL